MAHVKNVKTSFGLGPDGRSHTDAYQACTEQTVSRNVAAKLAGMANDLKTSLYYHYPLSASRRQREGDRIKKEKNKTNKQKKQTLP